MAKRKVHAVESDPGMTPQRNARHERSDMPAGRQPPTPGASDRKARRPPASAQTAKKTVSDSLQTPAAGAATPAASALAQPKHKKWRKSGEQSSAQTPAQQAEADRDGAADGVQPSTAGNAVGSAIDAASAEDAAALDPLSPAALQVPVLCADTLGGGCLCLIPEPQHPASHVRMCSGQQSTCHVTSALVILLQAHAAFFDHLVELVPPRHYHDLDADRVSTKYMKKADRDAAKAAFRKQHKQVLNVTIRLPKHFQPTPR